jgi:hypothetical protein
MNLHWIAGERFENGKASRNTQHTPKTRRISSRFPARNLRQSDCNYHLGSNKFQLRPLKGRRRLLSIMIIGLAAHVIGHVCVCTLFAGGRWLGIQLHERVRGRCIGGMLRLLLRAPVNQSDAPLGCCCYWDNLPVYYV